MRPLALAVLVACNGSDTDINRLVPEIEVGQVALDYGEQPVYETAVQPLFVRNGGRVPLEVQLDVGGDDAFSVEQTAITVPADGSVEVPVAFRPTTYLTYEGTLTLASDDPETPVLHVDLVGDGVPAPVPDLVVDPRALDFGPVAPGGDAMLYATLHNEGTADLHLGTLIQSGSGAFRLASDPSGGTVAAGSEIPLMVRYEPVHGDGDSGVLTIPSDDPDEETVEITLLGNGGGDFDYPVADIDCPDTAAPPEWVFLDGAASADPGGLALDHAWTLSRRPPGSQADLTSFVGDDTSFFADVAGDYEVQLVVTNEDGIPSAPARCTIEAIPQDALHVELTWDTTRADLDLHVMEDGAALFEKPGDCNFCNPNPSWGPGGAADDPRLDLDDRGGLGPENINIAAPADGRYHVKVHYFDAHGDGAVEATVRVYTNGTLAQELTRTLQRNEVWDVAQVNWPAATVGVQSSPSYPAVDRTCWP